jgi:hypothetical protein
VNETNIPQKGRDHTTAVIVATTLVLMTCILSCTAVLVILIMRMP